MNQVLFFAVPKIKKFLACFDICYERQSVHPPVSIRVLGNRPGKEVYGLESRAVGKRVQKEVKLAVVGEGSFHPPNICFPHSP